MYLCGSCSARRKCLSIGKWVMASSYAKVCFALHWIIECEKHFVHWQTWSELWTSDAEMEIQTGLFKLMVESILQLALLTHGMELAQRQSDKYLRGQTKNP